MNPLLISKIAGVVAVLLMAVSIWAKIQNIAELEMTVDNQKSTITQMQVANDSTVDSWEECLLVNLTNAEEVEAANERAHDAEVRLAAAKAMADAEVSEIEEDAADMRVANNDQICRLLTDRLPDSMFD
jgi:hypothetical protein